MTIFELLKDGGRALLDALFPRRQALATLRAKWGQPGDKAHIDRLTKIFTERGARLCFVELQATQAERLHRNETPLRLAEKKPKRDIGKSRALLLDADRYQLNSQNDFPYPDHHLKIDNTHVGPEAVAQQIIE